MKKQNKKLYIYIAREKKQKINMMCRKGQNNPKGLIEWPSTNSRSRISQCVNVDRRWCKIRSVYSRHSQRGFDCYAYSLIPGKVSDTCSHNARGSDKFPQCYGTTQINIGTNMGKFSSYYTATKMWNALTASL